MRSLHTKSWPPTMPGILQKVLGGWWVVVVFTPNSVFCFGLKLWFWPKLKLNNMEYGFQPLFRFNMKRLSTKNTSLGVQGVVVFNSLVGRLYQKTLIRSFYHQITLFSTQKFGRSLEGKWKSFSNFPPQLRPVWFLFGYILFLPLGKLNWL